MAISRCVTALVVLLVAALVGCGGGLTSQHSIPSGDGQTTAGSLAVSVPTINFGNVTVGSNATRTVNLTASGSAVSVSSGSWSGSGFSVSGITFPLVLNAGSSASFVVTFTPATVGDASGSVTFLSDASNSPTAEAFTGTGTQTAAHNVSIFWDPSASQVIGYNVYRGTTPGGPYPLKLTASPQSMTGFVDNTVLPGNTYYYVATSVDMDAVESFYSNQITATVP